jgi:hypothetical protein
MGIKEQVPARRETPGVERSGIPEQPAGRLHENDDGGRKPAAEEGAQRVPGGPDPHLARRPGSVL